MNPVAEQTVWRVPRNHVVTNGGTDAAGVRWDETHPDSPHGLFFHTEAAANEAIERWVRLLAEHVPEHQVHGPCIFMFDSDLHRFLPGVLRAHETAPSSAWEQRAEVIDIAWADDGLRVSARLWFRLRLKRKVKATTADGHEVWVDPPTSTPVTPWLPYRSVTSERANPELVPEVCQSYRVKAEAHVLRWGDQP